VTTTTERHRNLYAANCYLCGTEVVPNEGYLYQDTSHKAMRDFKYGSGKKTWKVRCKSCQNPPKAPKAPKPPNPFVSGFKRAERRSPIVKKAIQAMVDAGALPSNFEASWVDLKNNESNEVVFLTEDKDAVYGWFPSLTASTYGNISLSAKGTPYAFLMPSDNPDFKLNNGFPVMGEKLVDEKSGEVFYLFPACAEEDVPLWDSRAEKDWEEGKDFSIWLTGYLVPHGVWELEEEHLVHWETLRESGI
jgi:hypothetical protein